MMSRACPGTRSPPAARTRTAAPSAVCSVRSIPPGSSLASRTVTSQSSRSRSIHAAHAPAKPAPITTTRIGAPPSDSLDPSRPTMRILLVGRTVLEPRARPQPPRARARAVGSVVAQHGLGPGPLSRHSRTASARSRRPTRPSTIRDAADRLRVLAVPGLPAAGCGGRRRRGSSTTCGRSCAPCCIERERGSVRRTDRAPLGLRRARPRPRRGRRARRPHLLQPREARSLVGARSPTEAAASTCSATAGVDVFLDSDRPKLEFMNDRFAESLSDRDGEIHTVCIGQAVQYRLPGRGPAAASTFTCTATASTRCYRDDRAGPVARRDAGGTRLCSKRYLHVHESLQATGTGWADVRRAKARWVEEFSRYDAALVVHRPAAALA